MRPHRLAAAALAFLSPATPRLRAQETAVPRYVVSGFVIGTNGDTVHAGTIGEVGAPQSLNRDRHAMIVHPGRYQLRLPAGRTVLYVRAMGFLERRDTIDVAADMQHDVRVAPVPRARPIALPPTPPPQPFPPCGRVPGLPEGERFCIERMSLSPGVLVIRDSATWARLWRRHGVQVTARNGAPLSLAVGTDFSRQQVLVVSYGVRPRCAEDSTYVARVERTPDGMVARLRSPIDSFLPEPERPVWYDDMDARDCFGAVHVDVLRLPAGALSWRPLRAGGLVPPPADWVSTPSAESLARMPRRARSKWVVRLLRERETPVAVRAAALRLAVRDTNYDALNVAMQDSATWRDSSFLRALAYVDYERHSSTARRLLAGGFGAALAAERGTPRYELRLLADALRELQGERVQGVGAREGEALARALVANPVVRTSEPLLAALVNAIGARWLPDVYRDACALYQRQWPAWREAAWKRGEGRLRPRAACETER